VHLPPPKPPRLLFVKRNAANLMWFSVPCLVDYKKTLWFYFWLYVTDSERHQLLHTLTGRLTQASTSNDIVVKSLLFWGSFVINYRISNVRSALHLNSRSESEKEEKYLVVANAKLDFRFTYWTLFKKQWRNPITFLGASSLLIVSPPFEVRYVWLADWNWKNTVDPSRNAKLELNHFCGEPCE